MILRDRGQLKDALVVARAKSSTPMQTCFPVVARLKSAAHASTVACAHFTGSFLKSCHHYSLR